MLWKYNTFYRTIFYNPPSPRNITLNRYVPVHRDPLDRSVRRSRRPESKRGRVVYGAVQEVLPGVRENRGEVVYTADRGLAVTCTGADPSRRFEGFFIPVRMLLKKN